MAPRGRFRCSSIRLALSSAPLRLAPLFPNCRIAQLPNRLGAPAPSPSFYFRQNSGKKSTTTEYTSSRPTSMEKLQIHFAVKEKWE
jgi:hypothetical protein